MKDHVLRSVAVYEYIKKLRTSRTDQLQLIKVPQASKVKAMQRLLTSDHDEKSSNDG